MGVGLVPFSLELSDPLLESRVRFADPLALRWESLDFESGRLTIDHSVVHAPEAGEGDIALGESLYLSAPKTADEDDDGTRTISLDARTLAVLRRHRKAQAAEQAAAGPAWADRMGLMFTRPDGRPLHPNAVSKMFAAWVRQLGLPKVTLHSLRHSWATNALRQKIATKTVAARLGHRDESTTTKIYMHALRELDEEAAESVASLYFEQA